METSQSSGVEDSEARGRLAERARCCGIPEYMIGGILRYVFDRIEPGSFLRAVLENDLMRALSYADRTNGQCLQAYGDFLYNYVPVSCKGSRERVAAWLGEPSLEQDDE